MNLLVGDTAGGVSYAALRTQDGVRKKEMPSGKSQGEKFLLSIHELLEAEGLRPADLNALALVEGPGSFTGLRIGFSVMKGLAFALGIPLYLYNRLEMMAGVLAPHGGYCLPLIDAQRRSWYTALFLNGKLTSEWMDLEVAVLKGCLGDPVDFFKARNFDFPKDGILQVGGEVPSVDTWGPNVSLVPGELGKDLSEVLLARLEADFSAKRNPVNAMTCLPFYLRRSEAENLHDLKAQKKSPL